MFEAYLHLVKPSEAEGLVLVLIFGQEAWPPASQLLQTVNLLRAVLIRVANCAGGPPE